MATKPFIAEKGLMTQILGTSASLALAFAFVDGSRDETAMTAVSRIGMYADRTDSAEKIGVVVMGTESLSAYASKVTVGNGIVMDATNRRLGVSDSTALFVPLATLHLSKNGNAGLRADTYSDTPTATAGVPLYRARGTAAAPTAIRADDVMGFVGVYGYYATGGTPTGFSSTSRAKIEFLAANTWSNTSQGASVGLWTTAVGAVASTERVRLYADGGMQIGGTGANWGTSPGNGVLAIMQNQYIAPLTGTVLQVVGSNNTKTRIEAVATQTAGGAQTAYATFTGRTSRGPLANPTASLANDILVAISACGYGTTAWPTTNKGLIHVNAAEAWTDAAQGVYIGFDTTATGGLVTSEKVRIWGDGGVQIGGTFTASPGAGAIKASGGITCTTLTASGNASIGATTGLHWSTIDGGASAASDGGALRIRNNNLDKIQLGNTSAVIGGAYDQSAMLWAAAGINFIANGTGTTQMSLSAAGALTVSLATLSQVNINGTSGGINSLFVDRGGNNYAACFRAATDANIFIRPELDFGAFSGVAIDFRNDAETANCSARFRASSYAFTGGGVTCEAVTCTTLTTSGDITFGSPSGGNRILLGGVQAGDYNGSIALVGSGTGILDIGVSKTDIGFGTVRLVGSGGLVQINGDAPGTAPAGRVLIGGGAIDAAGTITCASQAINGTSGAINSLFVDRGGNFYAARIKVATDANIFIRPELDFGAFSGVAIDFRNDAENANCSARFRASSYAFTGGGVTCEAVSCTTLTASGGTMTIPSSTQVILAAGKLSCGDTSATSIQTAGGLGVAKEIVLTASAVGATYWGATTTTGATRTYGNGSGAQIFEKYNGSAWVEIGRFA